MLFKYSPTWWLEYISEDPYTCPIETKRVCRLMSPKVTVLYVKRFFFSSLYEWYLFPSPNIFSCGIFKTNTHTFAQEYVSIYQEYFWSNFQWLSLWDVSFQAHNWRYLWISYFWEFWTGFVVVGFVFFNSLYLLISELQTWWKIYRGFGGSFSHAKHHRYAWYILQLSKMFLFTVR